MIIHCMCFRALLESVWDGRLVPYHTEVTLSRTLGNRSPLLVENSIEHMGNLGPIMLIEIVMATLSLT